MINETEGQFPVERKRVTIYALSCCQKKSEHEDDPQRREMKAMATPLTEIMREMEKLTSDEQLKLAAKLIEWARRGATVIRPSCRWLDLMGAAPYPMMGEDAQAWVSRTRQEGNDEREKQWSQK
ncbi:MAG: hypothetical protein SF339_22660 [Blastocatellia bacterium]|nr:hypothetical protein [Blastocatellia bacterium]